MNGPGYYRIEYFPYDGQWAIIPVTLAPDVAPNLNKARHTGVQGTESEAHCVLLNSTGNIPAYILGANMIREAIRDNND